MGHSFCTSDTRLLRLTPLVQSTTDPTEAQSSARKQLALSNQPRREVRSSGFGPKAAARNMYEYEETRKQIALKDFVLLETPATRNDSHLERKNSKRAKKMLLGGFFQKGRDGGGKVVTVGKKTNDGKSYLQIVVDEVKMERERREQDQEEQQDTNRECRSELRTGEERSTGEGQTAKTNLTDMRTTDASPSNPATEKKVAANDKARPPTQNPEGKTGGKAKAKDKGKNKESASTAEDSSPVRKSFRLLPKPDLGSTGRDLASEGSGILARYGVAADTQNENDGARGPDMKQFIQGKTPERLLSNGIWNPSDDKNQARIHRNHTPGLDPTVDNQWSTPGLLKTSERSATNPAPRPWIQAASQTRLQVQDPAQDATPGPSKKPEDQKSPRCSQHIPSGPWPKNNLPTTPQHSAQSSVNQAWPTDALLMTPQHSAQNSIETKKSPCSTLKHSRAPSAFSAHGSIVDDGQSDVGSIEIMNAQSAEIVRASGVAGFYSRSTVKLPKPGPAPTRALPSLPEGHDGLAGVLGGATSGSPSRMAAESPLERPRVKVPPGSPTSKYRYSPCKSPTPKLPLMSIEPDGTLEKQRKLSDSSPTLPGPKSAGSASWNSSFHGETTTTMLERAQIQRVRSSQTLEERGLQGTQPDQPSVEVVPSNLRYNWKEANNREGSFHPSARYNPGIAFHPVTTEVSNLKMVQKGLSSPLGSIHQQTVCRLSPIILVNEQVPTTALAPLGQSRNDTTNSLERFEDGGVVRKKDVSQKPPEAAPGSEDKERFQHEKADIFLEAWPKPRAKSRDSNDTTNRVSVSDHHFFTNSKDLESKLDARISALERKNTILLRVVMAVLDESGSLSGPSGGDHSSGLSSTSSLYGSRESRLEAKFDAVLSFLQENKRLSTE